MLPLILLALGIGVALTAYELSPQVHARVDDYAHALRSAHEAHRAADVHLANARSVGEVAGQHVRATLGAQRAAQDAVSQQAAPAQLTLAPLLSPVPPAIIADAHAGAAQVAADAGVDFAISAVAANQQAAQSSADAARHARTAAERRAAADSAAGVLARGKRIEGALASLGVGQCGVHTYLHVTPLVRDAILAKLHAEGMTVTGQGPWDIDTQLAGVKLRALWDPKTQVLRLIVTASASYAPCAMIWARIDPTLREIIGT